MTALLGLCGCGGESKQYNMVLLVSDALRADVLGCYEGEAHTPNIDWLSERGVLLERAYATSPMTMPSAVSMLTGKLPSIYRMGVVRGATGLPYYHVPDRDLQLAEFLGESGYDVRMDVENVAAAMFNNFQGFEEMPSFDDLSPEEVALVENVTGIDRTLKRYRDMYGFLNTLLGASGTQPFFHVKWLLDPHSPYDPPELFEEGIDVDPGRLQRALEEYSSLEFISAKTVGDWTDYEHDYLERLYQKEVESIDERVGFIIRALRHGKLMDSTFVIFTSDHGEAFGEHGEWSHGQDFYEHLVRVPLIIAGPGIPQGREVGVPVSHLDLTSTLKDLLGVEFEDHGQGKSYAGLLRGNVASERSPVYFEECAAARCDARDALLKGNLKLIILKDGTHRLHDLSRDPGEAIDVSGDNPEATHEMLKAVEKIRSRNLRKRKQFLSKMKQTQRSSRVDDGTLERLRELGYVE
jgi:arylsulfatase